MNTMTMKVKDGILFLYYFCLLYCFTISIYFFADKLDTLGRGSRSRAGKRKESCMPLVICDYDF